MVVCKCPLKLEFTHPMQITICLKNVEKILLNYPCYRDHFSLLFIRFGFSLISYHAFCYVSKRTPL